MFLHCAIDVQSLTNCWICMWMLVLCKILLVQNKEVISLRGDHEQLVEMKTEMQRLHAVELTCKQSTDRITELELIIAQLTQDLDREKLEKEAAMHEKEVLKKESEVVGEVSTLLSAILYFCDFS